MRDSLVSVTAAQTKCCVCFAPLKIFLNFARRTIFRNIEISEYRAVPYILASPPALSVHTKKYLFPIEEVSRGRAMSHE